MCFQNINCFILAAMTFFGMREEDLFDADDLFHASRYELIISTLSKLSFDKKFTETGLAYDIDPGLHAHRAAHSRSNQRPRRRWRRMCTATWRPFSTRGPLSSAFFIMSGDIIASALRGREKSVHKC